jgi:phage shock protein PspC (stress-responsive transcriptional regulator)
MHRILHVSLNAFTYQVDDGGYDALRAYLDAADARLRQDPDREEILKDLEQAIGEKCAARSDKGKMPLSAAAIAEILEAMGPVLGEAPDVQGQKEADGRPSGDRPPRLYRVQEGALLAGLCKGAAAYFNIDVLIVRIVFVILTILTGAYPGVLAYLVLMFIVPERSTGVAGFSAAGWKLPKVRTATIVAVVVLAILVFLLLAPWRLFHSFGPWSMDPDLMAPMGFMWLVMIVFNIVFSFTILGALLLFLGFIALIATVVWRGLQPRR